MMDSKDAINYYKNQNESTKLENLEHIETMQDVENEQCTQANNHQAIIDQSTVIINDSQIEMMNNDLINFDPNAPNTSTMNQTGGAKKCQQSR